MKPEYLSFEEGLRGGKDLPFAWICSMSSVSLGKTPREIGTDELLEARFFNEEQEIRLFQREEEWKAVSLAREPEDSVLENWYPVIKEEKFGRKILVRQYLGADEDGQTIVTATCLAGWEGGEADGSE